MSELSVSFDLGFATTLNQNKRLNRYDAARIRRDLRLQGKVTAMNAGLRNMHLGPSRVTVAICPPSEGQRFDPDNFAPTWKSLCDGMVDAGVWADDDWKHIVSTTYMRGEPTGKRYAWKMRVAIDVLCEPTTTTEEK